MTASDDVPTDSSAIGAFQGLEESNHPLFNKALHYEDIGEPSDGGWLANQYESGQTFDQFVQSGHYRPSPERDTIYIQPIEDFESEESPPLGVLEAFAQLYFWMPVVIRPPIFPAKSEFTTRENPDNGEEQLLTRDVVKYLGRQLPEDAFCLVGVSARDLYPKPSWNFVFGQAWPSERTGIYSFARYTGDGVKMALKRSMKVMAHEIGHLFGINHCLFYRCGMNGSNHLDESDRRPIHLCPVDLRKLHWSVKFDPVHRYRQLAAFYRQFGFEAEADWVRRRLSLVD